MPVIQSLHDDGRLRVWSLVITVFGDSVQHRGGRVATARLRALLGRIGVEDGTLRTALSRLGTDGWVQSERSGRSSTYSLSRKGLSKFAGATKAIYAPATLDQTKNWCLWVGPDGTGGFDLGGQTWVGGEDAEGAQKASICVTGDLTRVTEAVSSVIVGDAHKMAVGTLRADLAHLAGKTLAPLDAAAARTLLVHRWRRLVLRYPDVPNVLLPPGHPGIDLRRDVATIYHQLTPGAEAWLDADDNGLTPMPAQTDIALNRFT